MAVSRPFSITAYTLIITNYNTLFITLCLEMSCKTLLILILARKKNFLCYFFFGLKIFYLNARFSVFESELIHFCRMRLMILDDNLMTGQHD